MGIINIMIAFPLFGFQKSIHFRTSKLLLKNIGVFWVIFHLYFSPHVESLLYKKNIAFLIYEEVEYLHG